MRGRGSGISDEFIREVDEAVRQDRWLQLWKHYGTYFVAGALAIVLGTGAGVAWRSYQASQRLEEARRYAAAEELLRQDRPAEAADAFRNASKAADLEYLKARYLIDAARAFKTAGKQAEAVAAYRAVIDSFPESPSMTEAKVRLAELTDGKM